MSKNEDIVEDIKVSSDGEYLYFISNKIQFAIYLKNIDNRYSISIEFGTKNLDKKLSRKKMTSSILYMLKQNETFINFLKDKCHEAIEKAYENIIFSPENNIWTDSIISHFLGGNISFTIATTEERSINKQNAYIDDFINNVFIPSKTGYNDQN